MAYIDLLSPIHKKTKRDYLARVNEFPKHKAATIAKRFDRDYWDGDRKVGYGGFYYDGRWMTVAQELVNRYSLKPGDRVLDIGCGKAFLIFDLTQIVPGIEVAGIDVSEYGIEHAKEEVKNNLVVGNANNLPYEDNYFDLVISINTLHNLPCYDLQKALKEIERVGKNKKYIVVESYRNEEEKANLLYWQLTCESFYSPEEWKWWFIQTGFTGDHSFIYFE